MAQPLPQDKMKCKAVRISLFFLLLPVIATECYNYNNNPQDAENVQIVDSITSGDVDLSVGRAEVVVDPVSEVIAYKSPVMNFLYPHGLSVQEIVDLEGESWHWHPWKHIRVALSENGEPEEAECEVTNSVDDLPDDLFTRTCLQCSFVNVI